jgi:hypothetical protein
MNVPDLSDKFATSSNETEEAADWRETIIATFRCAAICAKSFI